MNRLRARDDCSVHLDLIPTTIECYRSSHRSLKLAALRLFHGLSRSVDQLHTTFNDTICDILLDALKSSDLSLVKTSSCVVSNSVLEFSICRTVMPCCSRVANIVILPSCWSRNSFPVAFWIVCSPCSRMLIKNCRLTVFGPYVTCRTCRHWRPNKISFRVKKQRLIMKTDFCKSHRLGLTIDRIYALLEQCTDEKFLLCLISLLRNLFHEKDMDTLLPLFNSDKLQSVSRSARESHQPLWGSFL